MIKKPRHYYRPQGIEEALKLLEQPDTVPLGGGTKLLAGPITAAVVDLQDLGLDSVEPSEQHLRIGSMTRLDDLNGWMQEHGKAESPAAMISTAVHREGPNTLRNAATVGGTIASLRPDSELLAALLLLECRVDLLAPQPIQVALGDYLNRSETRGGLITSIEIDWPAGSFSHERVGRTPADYAIVSIYGWKAKGGLLKLAGTGATERPIRFTTAESVFNVTGGTVAAAASAAGAMASHQGDFRGDGQYRADMAVVLSRRVLERLADA